jgi:hypothetical protein
MDVHVRAVGILHIVFGALTLGIIALLGLFFSAFVALAQAEWPDIAVFAGFGALLAVPFILVAIVQLVSATFLLRGSIAARTWVLVVAVLGLLSFPLGTALGVYTLWALLRKPPVSPAPPLPGVAGA